MPRTQIFVGYDVVDNDHFRSGADAARAAPRPKELPVHYFLTSCRLIPKKNLHFLVSAYAAYKAAARADVWSLVILGDGPQRASLEELCKELNVVDTVQLLGFKSYSELPVYYAWAGALFFHLDRTMGIGRQRSNGLRIAGACFRSMRLCHRLGPERSERVHFLAQ